MDNQADRDRYPTKPPTSSQLPAERSGTALSPSSAYPDFYLPEEEETGLDLLALWRTIVKRKWTIIVFLIIVVIAGTTASFLTTPIYQASLTLQIDRETPKIVEYQNAGQVETYNDYDFYQTQYELLKSRQLAEKVSDELALAGAPTISSPPSLGTRLSAWLAKLRGKEATAAAPTNPLGISPGALLGGLQVTPVRNSRIVQLSFDSTSPVFAAKVVNTWAATFITMNLERRIGASSYAKDFLEERLKQIKVKLEDSERELVAFAGQQEIVNLDERQTISTQKLQSINGALNQAEQARIKAESLYRQMLDTHTQGLSQILESPVIQELKQTRVALEAQYEEGLKIYKPAYPRMRQLESQINEVQAQIDEEVGYIRAAVEANYEAAKAEEKLLRNRLEEVKQEVITLQNRSIRYNILKREVDTNRQLYDGLLQRFKEVGVAGAVEANNISIVDKALVPNGPVKPNHKKNFLLCLFLGFLGGIGLAFLFERFDDTLKQPEEVERQLGIPVLGIVPIEHGQRKRAKSNTALALLAQENPRSTFAEAYRSVRTALQFSTAEGVPKVLLITSSASGEGKSTTALSLAIHFAQTGKRVLLVDADLRNPSLHRDAQLDNSEGLTHYLAGDAKPADIARPTAIANLFLISAGSLPPNPAELLSSAKMVSFLALAADKFDQVIVDSPPVLGLADSVILSNLVGGTVLVIESGSTRRGYAQGSLKRLKTARAHVLGAVLTKLEATHGTYGYYPSYYYYNDATA